MPTTTNPKRKFASQKAAPYQQEALNQACQITDGKVQELQQEVSNLKALVEIMKKEIDALNALVRYLEPHRATGKT